MYANGITRDHRGRGQLEELFRGHPDLTEAALKLLGRKEKAEYQRRQERFNLENPPFKNGKFERY